MFQEALNEKLRKIFSLGAAAAGASAGRELQYKETSELIIAEILKDNIRPKVGVGVIVLDVSDEAETLNILLEKRKHRYGHGDGEYSVPGGWMEHGETFEEAALRELFEETGLKADGARFLTAVTTRFSDELHCVTGFVVVRQWYPGNDFAIKANGPVIMEAEKTAELGFWPFRSLPSPIFPPLTALRDSGRVEFCLDELAGRKRK